MYLEEILYKHGGNKLFNKDYFMHLRHYYTVKEVRQMYEPLKGKKAFKRMTYTMEAYFELKEK